MLRKPLKIIAILISIVLLCNTSVYSYPTSRDYLRVPVGDHKRLEEFLGQDPLHFLSTANSETGQKVNMVVQEAAGLFDANTPAQCVDATRWIAAKLDNLDIKNQERTINIPFDASKEIEIGDPTTSHTILEAIFDDTIWVIDTQLMQFTLLERNKLKLPEKFVFQYVYQASDYYAKVPVFSDSVCAERIDSATISLAYNHTITPELEAERVGLMGRYLRGTATREEITRIKAIESLKRGEGSRYQDAISDDERLYSQPGTTRYEELMAQEGMPANEAFEIELKEAIESGRLILESLRPDDKLEDFNGELWTFDGQYLLAPNEHVAYTVRDYNKEKVKIFNPEHNAVIEASRSKVIRAEDKSSKALASNQGVEDEFLESITVKMLMNGEPVSQNEMKQVMDKPLYADIGPCICLINGDRMFHVNNEVYLQYNEAIMSRIRNSFDFTKTTYIFDNYKIIKQVDNARTSAINKALSDIPNAILWERNDKALRRVVLYPNLEFKVYDEDIFNNPLIGIKRGIRSAI